MYEQVLSGVDEPVTRVSVGRYFAVSILGLALVAMVAQIGLSGWSNGRIMAGVTVGSVQLGGLNLAEARARLNAGEATMTPSFVVAGKRYQPSLGELGVRYDTETALKQAYQVGREGIAPHPEAVNVALVPVVDSKRLADYLAPITKLGTAASDARLEVRKGELEVVPDAAGFTVDTTRLQDTLKHNLKTFHATEPVLEAEAIAAKVKAADLTEAQAQAAALMATVVSLTDETAPMVVAPADIAGWLSFGPDETGKIVAKVDTAKVAAYVAALAKRIDHPATDRKVTIADGKQSVQSEGANGDGIDQAPVVAGLSGLVAGTPLNLTLARHAVAFKTVTTNLTGIASGKYIEINLSKQHLWVWDDHQVVYDSPVTSGAVGAGLGTVTGTFHIYSKEANRYLSGRDYRLHVNYWMPFYRDYGLHDAYWRNGRFGGQDYIRAGSHGCVNLPDATAAWIYKWSEIGTTVYIHK